MKRILIFSMAYLPRHVGGAEIAIKEITERIPSEDIEFHLIANRYDSALPKTEKIGNVIVHRIGFAGTVTDMADLRRFPLHLNKPLYQFLAFFKAIQLHRKYRFDGIWAMMAHATGVPAGLFKLFHPQIPYILTLQEGDPPRDIERTMLPLWPLFSRAFTSADVVQAISSFLGSWAERRGARVVEVIPNGVDVERFGKKYPAEARSARRASVGVGDHETLFITVSRLVGKNGIDMAIEALRSLPAETHLAILGSGPEHDALMGLTERCALSSRVHFLGEISQEEVPLWLASADVFVRASRSEGQGIAFVEAMAAGLPTVGTRVGGIPDVIQDGETGFLAEPDTASLVSTLARVLADPVRAGQIAEHAQGIVRERYGWEGIVAEMRTKIFSVVAKP